jgi:hypothetical protein
MTNQKQEAKPYKLTPSQRTDLKIIGVLVVLIAVGIVYNIAS